MKGAHTARLHRSRHQQDKEFCEPAYINADIRSAVMNSTLGSILIFCVASLVGAVANAESISVRPSPPVVKDGPAGQFRSLLDQVCTKQNPLRCRVEDSNYSGGWSIFMAKCTGKDLEDLLNWASTVEINVWGPGQKWHCPDRGIAFPLRCDLMCVKNGYAVQPLANNRPIGSNLGKSEKVPHMVVK